MTLAYTMLSSSYLESVYACHWSVLPHNGQLHVDLPTNWTSCNTLLPYYITNHAPTRTTQLGSCVNLRWQHRSLFFGTIPNITYSSHCFNDFLVFDCKMHFHICIDNHTHAHIMVSNPQSNQSPSSPWIMWMFSRSCTPLPSKPRRLSSKYLDAYYSIVQIYIGE